MLDRKARTRIDWKTNDKVGEERLINDLAHQIVREMNTEELKALFGIKVIDPRSDKNMIVLKTAPRSQREKHDRELIQELHYNRMIQYQANF